MSQTILLSAGHTNILGQDRGAVSGGFIEGVEATRVRDAVAAYLKESRPDIKILEDGFDGDNQPLTKAVALARTANIALEFHFNAASLSRATGIEVLAKSKDRALAQRIAGAIAGATGLSLRGGDGGYKTDNSGQHHRLAFCEAGGLIVEICFISNPADMNSYKNNFDAMCRSVADVLAAA